MNWIDQLLSSDAAHRLGWSLVHSVWQGLAVAAVLALALVVIPKRNVRARYLCSCLALVVTLGLFAATAWMVPPKTSIETVGDGRVIVSVVGTARQPLAGGAELRPGQDSAALAMPPAESPPPVQSQAPPLLDRISARISPWVGWPVAAWFAGVLAFSIWHLGGWVAARRLPYLGTKPLPSRYVSVVRSFSDQLGIRRSVQLLQSAVLKSPMVFGWLKPVILMPVGILSQLSAVQIEAILAHELAHIRRYDYLFNLLQTLAETLLFHHPAVWWISRCIRNERECCCDVIAVELTTDRLNYAQSLAAIAELHQAGSRRAVAADGGSLLSRIKRVLGSSSRSPVSGGKWVAGLLVITACVAVALAAVNAGNSDQAVVQKAGVRKVVSRTYDLGDLIESSKDALVSVPPVWTPHEDPKGDKAKPAADRSARANRIAGVIRSTIKPGTWEPEGKVGRIQVDGNTLVVNHTAAAHRDIARLITQLGVPGKVQVVVESRFFQLPRKQDNELRQWMKGEFKIAGKLEDASLALIDAQAKSLMAKVSELPPNKTLTSPTVQLLNGKAGCLSIVSQTAIPLTDSSTGKPVVTQFSGGMVLHVTPTVGPDRKTVTMILKPRYSRLVEGSVFEQALTEQVVNVQEGKWLLLSMPCVRLKAVAVEVPAPGADSSEYKVKTVAVDQAPDVDRIYMMVRPRIVTQGEGGKNGGVADGGGKSPPTQPADVSKAPWSEAANGLRARLLVMRQKPTRNRSIVTGVGEPAETPKEHPVLELENVSDQPIHIPLYGGELPVLTFAVKDHPELRSSTSYGRAWMTPHLLKPGDVLRHQLSGTKFGTYFIGCYRPDPNGTGVQPSDLGGKAFEVSAVMNWGKAEMAAKPGDSTKVKMWTGRLTTNSVQLRLGVPPTAKTTEGARPANAIAWRDKESDKLIGLQRNEVMKRFVQPLIWNAEPLSKFADKTQLLKGMPKNQKIPAVWGFQFRRARPGASLIIRMWFGDGTAIDAYWCRPGEEDKAFYNAPPLPEAP